MDENAVIVVRHALRILARRSAALKSRGLSAVPCGDSRLFSPFPAVETAGYYHPSRWAGLERLWPKFDLP